MIRPGRSPGLKGWFQVLASGSNLSKEKDKDRWGENLISDLGRLGGQLIVMKMS